MYVESLRLIPPNTGLLIIQDGETRYEIRFEGDLQEVRGLCLEERDNIITSKYYSILYTQIFSSKHYPQIEY